MKRVNFGSFIIITSNLIIQFMLVTNFIDSLLRKPVLVLDYPALAILFFVLPSFPVKI